MRIGFGCWRSLFAGGLKLEEKVQIAVELAVCGIYAGIDLLMYNFVEPLVYGNTTGLTPLAILIAAVFWAWLWGAVGLLLAVLALVVPVR